MSDTSSNSDSIKKSKIVKLRYVDQSQDGSGQSIGVAHDGGVYTWGPLHSLGQLGRTVVDKNKKGGKKKNNSIPTLVSTPDFKAVRGFAGGFSDSGHTAIIDNDGGHLWLTGSDRWQQLGLGSPNGGSTGYTWKGGKLYQFEFQKNEHVLNVIQKHGDKDCSIRDVALGGDHTVVLSSNQRDVITFGKGTEGQLGLSQKAFVSAPIKSSELSTSAKSSQADETKIPSAVCAIQYCSLTLNKSGEVLKTAGKCRETTTFLKALQACKERAYNHGVLIKKAQSNTKSSSSTTTTEETS